MAEITITYEWLVEQGACYYKDEDNPTELGAWLKPKLPISIQQLQRMRKIPSGDKLWALIRLMDDRQQRLLACRCVREIWHLLEDDRSRNAVEVAERYANGEATDAELSAARSAARSAAWDAAGSAAYAAWDAARSATRSATRSAAYAAYAAYVAWDATWYAANAAYVAWDAARSAANAARSEARAKQVKIAVAILEKVAR